MAARQLHSQRPSSPGVRDNSIPFDFDGVSGAKTAMGDESTITPVEAAIFKSIFDEIAQGKMPAGKKTRQRLWTMPWTPEKPDGHRVIVQEFREQFLQRYPSSLRDAAQVALGLYEMGSGEDSEEKEFMDLDAEREKKWAQKAMYDVVRVKERKRVEALMADCDTDVKLWKLMKKEVFSLPKKFGIVEQVQVQGEKEKPKKRGRKSKKEKELEAMQAQSADATVAAGGPDEAVMAEELQAEYHKAMNVHGPLYPHYIQRALSMFDKGFENPSPYTFQILPQIKALSLASYVLGVSTQFYTQLASIHWNRYGDVTSALDVLQEMNTVGLYADLGVVGLLATIKEQLHSCAWGGQGPFVMAMMEAPPYNAQLMERLDGMERWARYSSDQRAREQNVKE